MGLFDGAADAGAAPGRRGATADLAAHFGLPVVLVIDVARQAQSAAAVVRGFATHDPAVRIAGVILNRVGSSRHRAFVADAIAALGIPVLGTLPREAALALPERHLGLVQASEHPDFAALIDRLAATAETYFDLDAIIACAGTFTVTPIGKSAVSAAAARTAHRARQRPGLQLRLSASDRRLARRRRRDRIVLAACRRTAAARRRLLLAARRLSGTACRCARRRANIRRRTAPFRRDAPGARRVRRLHGIGRRPGRCGGPPPRHDRPARPRDKLRPAQTSSRLSHRAAALRQRAGSRREHKYAATNSTTLR